MYLHTYSCPFALPILPDELFHAVNPRQVLSTVTLQAHKKLKLRISTLSLQLSQLPVLPSTSRSSSHFSDSFSTANSFHPMLLWGAWGSLILDVQSSWGRALTCLRAKKVWLPRSMENTPSL